MTLKLSSWETMSLWEPPHLHPIQLRKKIVQARQSTIRWRHLWMDTHNSIHPQLLLLLKARQEVLVVKTTTVIATITTNITTIRGIMDTPIKTNPFWTLTWMSTCCQLLSNNSITNNSNNSCTTTAIIFHRNTVPLIPLRTTVISNRCRITTISIITLNLNNPDLLKRFSPLLRLLSWACTNLKHPRQEVLIHLWRTSQLGGQQQHSWTMIKTPQGWHLSD